MSDVHQTPHDGEAIEATLLPEQLRDHQIDEICSAMQTVTDTIEIIYSPEDAYVLPSPLEGDEYAGEMRVFARENDPRGANIATVAKQYLLSRNRNTLEHDFSNEAKRAVNALLNRVDELEAVFKRPLYSAVSKKRMRGGDAFRYIEQRIEESTDEQTDESEDPNVQMRRFFSYAEVKDIERNIDLDMRAIFFVSRMNPIKNDDLRFVFGTLPDGAEVMSTGDVSSGMYNINTKSNEAFPDRELEWTNKMMFRSFTLLQKVHQNAGRDLGIFQDGVMESIISGLPELTKAINDLHDIVHKDMFAQAITPAQRKQIIATIENYTSISDRLAERGFDPTTTLEKIKDMFEDNDKLRLQPGVELAPEEVEEMVIRLGEVSARYGNVTESIDKKSDQARQLVTSLSLGFNENPGLSSEQAKDFMHQYLLVASGAVTLEQYLTDYQIEQQANETFIYAHGNTVTPALEWLLTAGDDIKKADGLKHAQLRYVYDLISSYIDDIHAFTEKEDAEDIEKHILHHMPDDETLFQIAFERELAIEAATQEESTVDQPPIDLAEISALTGIDENELATIPEKKLREIIEGAHQKGLEKARQAGMAEAARLARLVKEMEVDDKQRELNEADAQEYDILNAEIHEVEMFTSPHDFDSVREIEVTRAFIAGTMEDVSVPDVDLARFNALTDIWRKLETEHADTHTVIVRRINKDAFHGSNAYWYLQARNKDTQETTYAMTCPVVGNADYVYDSATLGTNDMDEIAQNRRYDLQIKGARQIVHTPSRSQDEQSALVSEEFFSRLK